MVSSLFCSRIFSHLIEISHIRTVSEEPQTLLHKQAIFSLSANPTSSKIFVHLPNPTCPSIVERPLNFHNMEMGLENQHSTQQCSVVLPLSHRVLQLLNLHHGCCYSYTGALINL